MEIYRYIIPGVPATKKNSMQMVKNPKNGKWFPVASKAYKKYEASALQFLFPKPVYLIDYPINVKCIYAYPLKKNGDIPQRLPDLANLLEATDDILVKGRIIKDDNICIITSHDGSHAFFTPGEPYTEIIISEVK